MTWRLRTQLALWLALQLSEGCDQIALQMPQKGTDFLTIDSIDLISGLVTD